MRLPALMLLVFAPLAGCATPIGPAAGPAAPTNPFASNYASEPRDATPARGRGGGGDEQGSVPTPRRELTRQRAFE